MAQVVILAEKSGAITIWWVVVGILLVLFLIWLLFRLDITEEKQPESTSQTLSVATKPTSSTEAEVAPAELEPSLTTPVATESVKPDDLKRIEGIGPKISAILQKAGITSFAMLADTPPDRLREILDEAGIRRISDPTTWPEQAVLAAAGRWDELKALQGHLTGGRREK